jgi:hypothetical protein
MTVDEQREQEREERMDLLLEKFSEFLSKDTKVENESIERLVPVLEKQTKAFKRIEKLEAKPAEVINKVEKPKVEKPKVVKERKILPKIEVLVPKISMPKIDFTPVINVIQPAVKVIQPEAAKATKTTERLTDTDVMLKEQGYTLEEIRRDFKDESRATDARFDVQNGFINGIGSLLERNERNEKTRFKKDTKADSKELSLFKRINTNLKEGMKNVSKDSDSNFALGLITLFAGKHIMTLIRGFIALTKITAKFGAGLSRVGKYLGGFGARITKMLVAGLGGKKLFNAMKKGLGFDTDKSKAKPRLDAKGKPMQDGKQPKQKVGPVSGKPSGLKLDGVDYQNTTNTNTTNVKNVTQTSKASRLAKVAKGSLKVAKVGAKLGARLIPGLGWGLLAYDLASFLAPQMTEAFENSVVEASKSLYKAATTGFTPKQTSTNVYQIPQQEQMIQQNTERRRQAERAESNSLIQSSMQQVNNSTIIQNRPMSPSSARAFN